MSHSAIRMILLTIAIILIGAAVALCWYFILGRPNPPLTQKTVTFANTTAASGTAPADDGSPNEPNPPLPAEPLVVDGTTFSVEIASSALEQTRGLSYRQSLGAQDGMLFIFSKPSTQTFWMKDMNFALDMIWISGDTVVGIAANAPAPSPGTMLWQLPVYSSPSNTDKVLEVVAGTAAKYHIKVGDTILIGGQ